MLGSSLVLGSSSLFCEEIPSAGDVPTAKSQFPIIPFYPALSCPVGATPGLPNTRPFLRLDDLETDTSRNKASLHVSVQRNRVAHFGRDVPPA